MAWHFPTLGLWLALLPLIISIAGAVALVVHTVFPRLRRWMPLLVITVIVAVCRVAYPALLSGLQWWVWSSNPFGKILLNQPLDPSVPLPWEGLRALFDGPLGYFSFYVIGRFWLPVAILFVVAGLLSGVVALVRRMRADSLPDGSALIIFVAALVAGWPGVIIFVPMWAAISVVMGAYAFYQKKTLHVSLSLAIAAVVTVLFGPLLLSFFYTHMLVI